MKKIKLNQNKTFLAHTQILTETVALAVPAATNDDSFPCSPDIPSPSAASPSLAQFHSPASPLLPSTSHAPVESLPCKCVCQQNAEPLFRAKFNLFLQNFLYDCVLVLLLCLHMLFYCADDC